MNSKGKRNRLVVPWNTSELEFTFKTLMKADHLMLLNSPDLSNSLIAKAHK